MSEEDSSETWSLTGNAEEGEDNNDAVVHCQ